MPIAVASADPDTRPGWRAELELDFVRRGPRTVLGRRRHLGPLMVQSAFHPEGAPCHVYVLHPPGGLVGGDELALDVQVATGAHALVTTPASGKIYRSTGRTARVQQRLRVEAGATLEWLPAETIVFDGAACETCTRADLSCDGRLLAWEAWGLGRPASGERFVHGRFTPSLEVWCDGRPLLVERNRVDGGGAWLDARFGLAGHDACATLVAHPADAGVLAAARAAVLGDDLCVAAAGVVDGVLACRALARGLAPLRRQLEAWWHALRPLVAGRDAVAPRIWAT